MSLRSWPVVLVGLGSLGFLAATVAQQTDPTDFGEAPPVSIQFQDLDEPNLRKTTDDTQSRWAADETNNANNHAGVRLQGDIQEFMKRQPFGANRRSANDSRRFADEPDVRLSDTQPETAQIDDSQKRSLRNRDRVSERSTIAPGATRRRVVELNGQPTDGKKRASDGLLFDTRETAILGDAPGISANRSVTAVEDPKPSAPAVPGTVLAQDNPLSGVTDDVAADNQKGDVTAAGKLPLWSTMALLSSIAANLFFCWIAWDAHSKYQDLVEDMSESDIRLERQTRRLRNSEGSSRRIRDIEDSDRLRAVEG